MYLYLYRFAWKLLVYLVEQCMVDMVEPFLSRCIGQDTHVSQHLEQYGVALYHRPNVYIASMCVRFVVNALVLVSWLLKEWKSVEDEFQRHRSSLHFFFHKILLSVQWES